MNSSTLSNDPLSDKRFDFQFDNPPYGYEWSKGHDADTTREPMQNNPSVRQRPGQRGLKPETLPPLLPSSFSRFTFPVLANGSMSSYQSGEGDIRHHDQFGCQKRNHKFQCSNLRQSSQRLSNQAKL